MKGMKNMKACFYYFFMNFMPFMVNQHLLDNSTQEHCPSTSERHRAGVPPKTKIAGKTIQNRLTTKNHSNTLDTSSPLGVRPILYAQDSSEHNPILQRNDPHAVTAYPNNPVAIRVANFSTGSSPASSKIPPIESLFRRHATQEYKTNEDDPA